MSRSNSGEPPGGTGEIPDLAWVDDRQRQTGADQSGRDGDLEPAGGLKHDQLRGDPCAAR
jgi:hypothetical protein